MARRREGVAARRAQPGSRPDQADLRAATAKVSTEPNAADSAVDSEPAALVVSHWFDSGKAGEPYTATIRLRGQRVDRAGTAGPRATFLKEETIEGVVPGSGPVSVSTWVHGIAPGEWRVSAEVMRPASHAGGARLAERRQRVGSERVGLAVWSWRRWAVSTGPDEPVKTRWAPLASLAPVPAVIPGIWVTLALLGIIVALAVQALILEHESVPVGQSLVVSLIVVVASLVAAKLWYAALHPGPWRQWMGGWSVDGFVFVGPPVAIVALIVSNLPVGTFLDAGTPGLFLGVAIGRVGCFLTGCCAGRCTGSRWGVWSSDRRIGARRIPAQLLESVMGLVIGAGAALAVIGDVSTVPGSVFVAAFAAYILGRQLLLRLRAESRQFSWRRSHSALPERH